jgi:hypothetical protein
VRRAKIKILTSTTVSVLLQTLVEDRERPFEGFVQGGIDPTIQRSTQLQVEVFVPSYVVTTKGPFFVPLTNAHIL